jgi:hypothetical protein
VSQGWSDTSFLVSFNWLNGDVAFQELSQPKVNLASAVVGSAQVLTAGDGTNFDDLPSIRCDRGMAVNGGSGCVYAEAPAVLVLAVGDASVKEAAIHIRDAQNAGSPGKLGFAADGSPSVSAFDPLQRTRVTGLKGQLVPSRIGANRANSCVFATSIIARNPQNSETCALPGALGCSCDEYPFNSTWNGSYSNIAKTSARNISGIQNSAAGTRLGQFYQSERVLDLTVDPGIIYNFGNEAFSIPVRLGGDDFWVHIE